MQSFKSAIFPAVSGFRAAKPSLTSRTAGQTPDDSLEVVVTGDRTAPPRTESPKAQAESQSQPVQLLQRRNAMTYIG